MLITGPVATRSGYGSHTRDLVRSLIAMDKFDIHINSLRWGSTSMNALDESNASDKQIIDKIMTTNELPRQPELHIQVSVPNEFTPPAKFKRLAPLAGSPKDIVNGFAAVCCKEKPSATMKNAPKT